MDNELKKKLDERLVNGEITIEEYENILSKIESESDESTAYDTGCPLQIIGFSSHNNIFTAGNNSVWFKVKNPSDMPYSFTVELETGGKWKNSGYRSFEIGPREIKEYSILGPAWRKSSDIRISGCI